MLKRVNNFFTAVYNYIRWRVRFYKFGFRSRLGGFDMLSNPKAISIGRKVEIRDHCRLEAIGDCSDGKPKVIIGDGTSAQFYFHCGAAESITIGKDVLIAGRVYITDHDHEFDNADIPPRYGRKLYAKPVVIEDGVWIGEGAVILKGVRVGERAVIGANAVVTKDIPPFSIAGGVPARVIKKIELKGQD
jgi:acetyltransferase-like isoleucine patch superfamily enzyme